MTLESSKILGGVGAILMFVGILPYISYFGILELVGLILVLVGLYGLGSFYNERGIFNNALYGVIMGIVGVVVAVVVAVVVVLTSLTSFIYQIFPGWNGDWTSLAGLTPDVSSLTDLSGIWSFIAGILVVFVVLWVFAIVAAFLVRRGLRQASDKTSVGLFSTAGLLLLVGAVLTVVVIGFILIWIAALLLAVAFFTVKSAQAPMATAAPPPPTPV